MTGCFAVGDPQTTPARFLGALRDAGLLSGERLRAGVRLLSMGDHFDFEPLAGWDWPSVSAAGEEILSWLAAHPPEQVTILFGNHDVCRVMELYRLTDSAFDAARAEGADAGVPKAEFLSRYPDLPSKGIAARDFSSFRVSQRRLVQRLLLNGRARLACVVETPAGHRALATHAGVTSRELALLGLSGCVDPDTIAAALNALLSERVARVRADWEGGGEAPLDLSPVHLTGTAGQEGGGLLYHRPQTAEGDGWSTTGARRFHPRMLPPGLLQVCGHTHHKKCRTLMPSEASALPTDDVGGRLRSISVRGGVVRYAVGLQPPAPEQATLWMTDGRIHYSDRIELLSLRNVYSEAE